MLLSGGWIAPESATAADSWSSTAEDLKQPNSPPPLLRLRVLLLLPLLLAGLLPVCCVGCVFVLMEVEGKEDEMGTKKQGDKCQHCHHSVCVVCLSMVPNGSTRAPTTSCVASQLPCLNPVCPRLLLTLYTFLTLKR